MELSHLSALLKSEKEISTQYYLVIQIVYLGLEAQDNQIIWSFTNFYFRPKSLLISKLSFKWSPKPADFFKSMYLCIHKQYRCNYKCLYMCMYMRSLRCLHKPRCFYCGQYPVTHKLRISVIVSPINFHWKTFNMLCTDFSYFLNRVKNTDSFPSYIQGGWPSL